MVSFSLYYSMSCLLNHGSHQRAFKEKFPYIYICNFVSFMIASIDIICPFSFILPRYVNTKDSTTLLFQLVISIVIGNINRVIAKFKTCNNISSWWDTTENEQQRIYIYIFFFFFFFRPLLAVAFLKMTQSEPRL